MQMIGAREHAMLWIFKLAPRGVYTVLLNLLIPKTFLFGQFGSSKFLFQKLIAIQLLAFFK